MTEYEPQLRAAAQRGNVSLMEQLLGKKKKPNVDNQDALGNTPLHYSAHHDHPETLEILLNNGANPNIQNNEGNTPLHKAAAKNSIPCIKALMDNGADPRIKNKEGKQAKGLAKSAEAKSILSRPVVLAAEVDKDMIADLDDRDD
ncbi:Oxysterol-binding protein-related protein 1 [Balamuthia mandrillaris]